jgi:HEXXH motif-containing protein
LITTHSLSESAFTELAAGVGGDGAVRELREAQLSKHLMMLHVIAQAAAVEPPSSAITAFRDGYRLLTEVQAVDPSITARLFGLPHLGSWAHNCLACLDAGTPADFGYLAAPAAAAAARLGIRFELDVPVKDGRVPLPGLGCLEVPGHGEWIRMSGDGERVRVGEYFEIACAALVPDDGTSEAVPHWQGTPLVRAVADGRTWEVLLETADQCLDRYTLPMRTAMTAAEVTSWRERIQAAWKLLVRHHQWAAGPIADGLLVIVPLAPRPAPDSATSPAAFGAVAASLPRCAVSMAEMLVHEFQHAKLCGLMDMMPLLKPGPEYGYAPWREDPRPLDGILQGVYAFTGIVRFWETQRRLGAQPDEVLHASVLYERWRRAVQLAADSLLSSGFLTPLGTRFLAALRQQGQGEAAEPVPADALAIAREIALDNRLTWQLRHIMFDAAQVAGLAAAYQRGEPFGDQVTPHAWIKSGVREVDPIARSRFLHMRYQDPGRYRQLSASDMSGLCIADTLLIREADAGATVAAYRERLAVDSDPAAWIGLALAVSRLSGSSAHSVFATRLPLIFEVHARLFDQGIHADPIGLAAWFK